MALLKEQRAALIQQAVTRGLNPNAPMKDSGIPWLEEIPAHWDVKRLKYVCRVTTGSKDTVDAEEDGAYPFFVRSQIIEQIGSYSFDGEAVLTAGDGARCFQNDQLFEAYARQLTLLTEYRAALIHECVTGKRPVPEPSSPDGGTAHAL